VPQAERNDFFRRDLSEGGGPALPLRAPGYPLGRPSCRPRTRAVRPCNGLQSVALAAPYLGKRPGSAGTVDGMLTFSGRLGIGTGRCVAVRLDCTVRQTATVRPVRTGSRVRVRARARGIHSRSGVQTPIIRTLSQTYPKAVMPNEDDSLKVGAVAQAAGVGVQTLHYYERLGLLQKPTRSVANYRLYSANTIRRLRFIKQAQAIGMTLEEIKEILGLKERGRSPCHRVAELGEKHLREIDARLAQMRAFRQLLARSVKGWRTEDKPGRRCAGEFCDLIERLL